MSQEKIEKLRELEKTIEKIKLAKVRSEERLSYLRQSKDTLVADLKSKGISPKNVDKKLTEMSDQIDADIKKIEEQIPPNLEELLNDGNEKNRK